MAALLRERNEYGWWTGELSASALSTATAITALTLGARDNPEIARSAAPLIRRGYEWLARHQNADGGWGDTTRSFSNISTTTLVWAAFGLPRELDDAASNAVAAAERWLAGRAGSLEPRQLVRAIESRYGKDRTFSIPILTMCALCGRLGPEREGWAHVRQLPFEIAALPQRWFGALQLPVVSYALPALIAIGQVRHGKRPTRNPLLRALRNRCRARTLAKLARLQPDNGGFLEATPLTSFVTMSLAALGLAGHVVVQRGVAFLEASVRSDGSWPIDTNLATWVTTLSVNALTVAPASSPGNHRLEAGAAEMPAGSRRYFTDADLHSIRDWLLRQQHRIEHPYTLAAPGGWAWTDLPGGVPDADDTAGALLALRRLGPDERAVRAAAEAGVDWLLRLQNRDGGIPTFCRGWGKLPFDRSSPDLTAHAIRAWLAWRADLPTPVQQKIDHALQRAAGFLANTQRADGAWVPLWFGHQEGNDDENPLYGTARVLPALCELEGLRWSALSPTRFPSVAERVSVSGADEKLTLSATKRVEGSALQLPISRSVDRAIDWLVSHQNADGGWAGARGAASSMEETGLALEALANGWDAFRARSPVPRPWDGTTSSDPLAAVQAAIARGTAWLVAAVENEEWRQPAPIGFYFAKLWYYERLYPLIFSTGALNRLAAMG